MAGSSPGLFAIDKTGISLTPLLEAARSFLAALTAEQRKAACFAIGDEAWRKWSNIHPWLMRHGVCLADLDADQREAALALMRETMSAAGYQSARDIMRLNEHALEITGKPEEYSEWFYWVSIFGDALAGRALGLADRRPSPQPQLLCARRPARADAHLHGLRAGAGALRQIQGNPRLRR